MARVICAGHVNWDVTLRVDRLPEPDGEAAIRLRTGAAGGSAANVAAGLAGLNVPVALLGSVGDDNDGHAALEELAATGVECGPVQTVLDGETALKYLIVDEDGEVMVLGQDGVNEAFAHDDVSDEELEEADHLHLTSQNPETAARLAARASEAGVTVSFDPGRRVGEREYRETFARSDLLFLNDREAAEALDETVGLDDQPIFVLKHGPEGAEVRMPGEETYTHPGFEVSSVDTAGAGDAFAAGFIASMLRVGDLPHALRVANACGAIATRSIGARARLDWTTISGLIE